MQTIKRDTRRKIKKRKKLGRKVKKKKSFAVKKIKFSNLLLKLTKTWKPSLKC
jgi:hypothetical protein